MVRILSSWRKLWGNRRTHDEPVAEERRVKLKHKEVYKRFDESMEHFDQTIRMKRDDFFRGEKFTANDSQQVVIFSTFREICAYRLTQGQYRLCKHPKHEAANTGVAKCEEQLCPALAAALRGAA